MIPRSDDITSSEMVHRFGDMFNPPGLTNFLGCVQADLDITGIRSLNMPPFACSDTVTAGLFVDGRYFPATGEPITFRWYPDRIEREARYGDLRLRSTTFLPVGRAAGIVLLEVENLLESERTVELRLGLRSSITTMAGNWTTPYPPAEIDNKVSVDRDRKALMFRSRWSKGVSLQGATPAPDEVTAHGLRYTAHLGGRGTWHLAYVNVLGDDVGSVRATYDELIRDPRAEREKTRQDWDAELAAVFTPGNDRYSGSLPVLETDDESIRRLYHIGALGVVYFKRDNPASAIGRAYDTLMPKFWQTVTFLWDYSLSSLVHAMLDPGVMKPYLERWMSTDIHTHFGTEWLTGAPVGCWYSVNDYAMMRSAHEYLRWSGDFSWLSHQVPSLDGDARPVSDFLEDYAHNWERFRTFNGLADYGKIGNLLECVSTYIHEVASLNAANVWSLRFLADLKRMAGDVAGADDVAAQSDDLSKEVRRLYAEGKGHWHARTPDGELVPVRHCYDFITILHTIPDDLSPAQRDEMTAFFLREMHTPTWMHALSTDDPDAMFSVRPDHQWTGAYTAWPAQAVAGLYRMGKTDLAFDWLQGLARSANQGPFGQAHFTEPVVPGEDGGARKAPADLPYITDWACSSGGAWVNVILESVFGLEATMDAGLTATPRFGGFDPGARLTHIPYQGRLYTADRDGVRPQD